LNNESALPAKVAHVGIKPGADWREKVRIVLGRHASHAIHAVPVDREPIDQKIQTITRRGLPAYSSLFPPLGVVVVAVVAVNKSNARFVEKETTKRSQLVGFTRAY
jgi:hypothetical protein